MKHTLFVCQNDRGSEHPVGSCKQKGSDELLDYAKSLCKENPEWNMRATASGCLGRCRDGIACVLYPDDQWVTHAERDSVEKTLQQHGDKLKEKLAKGDLS